MLHVYMLYNYHLVSFPRNTSCSKVLTAMVPGPRSQHPQQARLRKPPGWLRELVLASATGHPQAGSDDVELPVDFFAPLVSFVLPAAVFSRFRPQEVPHPRPSLRPQALVGFGYCSTVVPFFLFTDIQHISQKKSRDGNLFYSQRSRSPEIPLAISTHPVSLSGTRKPGMQISGGLCSSVRHTRGGREACTAAAYLHVN